MEEKEITINGKVFKIKEIKYKDVTKFADMEKDEAAKQLLLLSTNLTEEEYENLTMREGVLLQKEITELNGLTDFQEPVKLETS